MYWSTGYLSGSPLSAPGLGPLTTLVKKEERLEKKIPLLIYRGVLVNSMSLCFPILLRGNFLVDA